MVVVLSVTFILNDHEHIGIFPDFADLAITSPSAESNLSQSKLPHEIES